MVFFRIQRSQHIQLGSLRCEETDTFISALLSTLAVTLHHLCVAADLYGASSVCCCRLVWCIICMLLSTCMAHHLRVAVDLAVILHLCVAGDFGCDPASSVCCCRLVWCIISVLLSTFMVHRRLGCDTASSLCCCRLGCDAATSCVPANTHCEDTHHLVVEHSTVAAASAGVFHGRLVPVNRLCWRRSVDLDKINKKFKNK